MPRAAPQLPEFRRVLLVEDEALVGLELETALMRAGMEVLGPATTLSEALRLASESAADMALLDINLQGEHSFPVAEVLKMRGIPFVFCTGYARRMIIPEEFSHIPVVEKPYTIDRLFQAMDRAAEQFGTRKSPLH
jgi:DNA-binding NtrC family response regulator